MEQQSFDALTRYAAGDGPPRGSLMALAAAGFFAALSGSSTAAAKTVHATKNGGKKKKNKHQNQQVPQECPPLPADLCPGQTQACIDIFTLVCAGDPTCQDSIACCSHLRDCDFGGFTSCLLISQQN